MTAIASPEFISLCRAQLRLLTQRLATSSAALYITDALAQSNEQSNFVPVVSYPEPVESWVANFERATPWSDGSGDRAADSRQLALPGEAAEPDFVLNLETVDDAVTSEPVRSPDLSQEPIDPSAEAAAEVAFEWPDILHPEQQLVMPLVYTDVVVGLLVAVRPDRAWENEERRHVESVAQSLAGGCVLERRNQWLQSQLAHKRSLQSRQSEIFHNLLHQFRNPLTAVSTFGQLLVKRLDAEDTNQPIATGIVRENKRLRELVTHFDEAVAIGDADLTAESAQTAAAVQARILSPGQLASQPLLPGNAAGDAGSFASHPEGAELGHSLTLTAQYVPDIVGPVLAVSGIVAAEKGVALRAQVTSDTPSVWGEEEALGEVVSNLVDNAIKYSPAGARVWVQTGVSRDGEGGRHYQGIVVSDTGPGIPVEDQGQLFERNYRGVQAAGDIPGTGLGLAIAQSLVKEMQGCIEVVSPAVGTPWLPSGLADSESVGPGCAFIVWLLEVER